MARCTSPTPGSASAFGMWCSTPPSFRAAPSLTASGRSSGHQRPKTQEAVGNRLVADEMQSDELGCFHGFIEIAVDCFPVPPAQFLRRLTAERLPGPEALGAGLWAIQTEQRGEAPADHKSGYAQVDQRQQRNQSAADDAEFPVRD